jgi:hypothetical protein
MKRTNSDVDTATFLSVSVADDNLILAEMNLVSAAVVVNCHFNSTLLPLSISTSEF